MFSNCAIRRLVTSTAAMALLLTLASCASINNALSGGNSPGAKVTGVKLGDVTMQDSTLLFNLAVSNPYSVPLPLTNLDYTLATSGKPFATGSAGTQGSVPANGSKTLTLPIKVSYAELMRVASGLKPGGVTPYAASLTLSADAPVVGKISLPLSKEGSLPVPAMPKVELQDVQFKELSMDNAAAVMSVKVTNTNSFPLDLSKLSYSLALAGTPITKGGVGQAASFTPGGENTLTLPISFSPRSLGLAGFRMLTGQGADYNLEGTMNVGTPFGTIDLPYQRSGQTIFKR